MFNAPINRVSDKEERVKTCVDNMMEQKKDEFNLNDDWNQTIVGNPTKKVSSGKLLSDKLIALITVGGFFLLVFGGYCLKRTIRRFRYRNLEKSAVLLYKTTREEDIRNGRRYRSPEDLSLINPQEQATETAMKRDDS